MLIYYYLFSDILYVIQKFKIKSILAKIVIYRRNLITTHYYVFHDNFAFLEPCYRIIITIYIITI